MKAVITVIGKDKVGIIAKVSALLLQHNINILDISQTIMQDLFTMIMLVDIDNISIPFNDFVDKMSEMGKANNLEIHTMHEDIFNSMHRI